MGAPHGNKNASGPHKGGGRGKKNVGQMYYFNPKTRRAELKPYYRRKSNLKRRNTILARKAKYGW